MKKLKKKKKNRETVNLRYLCRNKLDKDCLVHDAANPDSKDLAKRNISDNIFEYTTFEIARNCKYGQ